MMRARIEPQLPMPAMRRDVSRMRAGVRFMKAGETSGLDRWTGTTLTADEIIRRHQRIVVARARQAYLNNDYVKGFVGLCVRNIVGPQGVTLQAQARKTDGTLDEEANQAIEAGWTEHGMRGTFDITGTHSRRQVEVICVQSLAINGEFMLRKIFGTDAGEWTFAVQVLDPQRCPVDFDRKDMPNGVFIRHGIEFNRYGRPLAFHFLSTDETEDSYSWGGRDYVRVAAAEIIHGFKVEMVGQKRGLPWVATSLFRLHHLGGFEEAAVQNARAGASKMGFITWKDGFGPECDDEDAELGDVAQTIDAEPLSFHELPEGAELKEFNPQFPSADLGPFSKSMLRGSSTGLGVLYPELANDLEGVNFSSIRAGTIDNRERWKEDQQFVIEVLHDDLFREWLPRALLLGKLTVKGRPLSAARVDVYRAKKWQPRRWAWVDPKADMDAAVSAMQHMLAAPSDIITEQGRDPQSVYRQIAADIKAMQDEGIPLEIIMLALGKKPEPPKAPPAPPKE